MKKIGITGQSGFIGYHLYNQIKLLSDKYKIIEFKKEYFESFDNLVQFVSECDIIIHLAAINRHDNDEFIYNENISFANKIVDALNHTIFKPHIIFSSSIQENNETPYGQSKKLAREILNNWAKINKSIFTGFVIPNVFGPFCKPNYNSFISTFSHKILNNEKPILNNNKEVDLIYIDNLVNKIISSIDTPINNDYCIVDADETISVENVLNTLTLFKSSYIDNNIIPFLKTHFDLNLFNTFRSYIDYENVFPKTYNLHEDNRGAFIEIVKTNGQGQISFSTTKTGITRGNHFHTRKIERFSVIKGKAEINIRKIGTDKIYSFILDGDAPSFVDMPIWYTHNIKNIGDEILYTNFWINEFFDEQNPDTYFEIV
jgi:UDP-2-acetamido-2,6-beta-L-arabino-hexul-4-ose reductase